MKSSIVALAIVSTAVNAGPTYKFPLQHREDCLGSRFSAKTGPVPSLAIGYGSTNRITNHDDYFYTTTITLCGQEFPVDLDTGSSDLWVKPISPLKGAEITKLNANITYIRESKEGPIALCPVSVGPYSVAKQALISVTKVDDAGGLTDNSTEDLPGVFGLGFDVDSVVNEAVIKSDSNATWGRSLLANLFYANPTTPNYIAFLFDRASDLDEFSQGSFTIGETEPQYSSVINQPALPVFPDAKVRSWAVAMDSVAINGVAIPLKSSVSGAPTGKTISVLDSGSSYAYGPKAAVDAIYSVIPGSYYYEAIKVWIVPCKSTTKVTFRFGGIEHSVHPLDLTYVATVPSNNGTLGTVCVATIGDLAALGKFTELDWLLGDTFLRNVYSMFDFGDLDTSTGGLVGHPFIKLLSLPSSNYDVATKEFQAARSSALAKLPPTFDSSLLGNIFGDPSSASSSSESALNNLASDASDANGLNAATLTTLQDDVSMVVKYLPVILGLLGANVLIVLVLLIVGCVFFIKRKGSGAYHPVKTYGH